MRRRQFLWSAAGTVGVTGRTTATTPRPIPTGNQTNATDEDDAASEDQPAETTGQEDNEPANATQQTEDPNPALAARTRAVLSEIDWFARQYPDAIQTYRAALQRGVRATNRLRGAERVSPTQARALQTTYDEIVRTVRGALAPQFPIHRSIRRRTETHTATVLRFARRNDTDRVKEELRRLESFTATYSSGVFVAENLPRVPILNRLIERLRAGSFVRSQPLLFRVYHGSTGFRSYVYEQQSFGRYDLLNPGYNTGFVERYDRLFLALDVPANRMDRYYLSVFEGQGATEQPFESRAPTPRDNQIVYVQQYPDAATAETAFSRLLNRDGVRLDSFREEPYELGDGRWNRVYYPFDGDVLYTLVARAGRTLQVIGPSRTAWEERVGWDRLLRRTFLAGE